MAGRGFSYRTEITIVEAEGLRAADKNGASDPYVVVTSKNHHDLEVKQCRTKIIAKTLNPTWGQTFKFRTRDATKIYLEVFDADVVGADDELGHITIDTKHMPHDTDIDEWYEVQGSGNTGNVHVRMRFCSRESDEESVDSDIGDEGYLASMKQRTGHAVGAAADGMNVSELTDKVKKLAEQNQKLMADKSAMVKRFAEERENIARDFWDKQQVKVRKRVADHVGKVIGNVVDKAGGLVKKKLKDPSMPIIVCRAVDGAVDGVMPDVKEEIIGKATAKIRKKKEVDHGDELTWCPNPFPKLRAELMYGMVPYDKTIWEKHRNPWWWITTLIGLFPRFGVQQIWFFLVLLMQDKRDEFQLVNYIISFKGMQFFSLGAVSMMVASLQYWSCIKAESCQTAAPGIEYWEMMFFVVQIGLVWAAYLLLPYSQKKGGVEYVLTEDEERAKANEGTPGCCGATKYEGRGGQIKKWIIYESIIFTFLVLAYAIYIFANGIDSLKDKAENEKWRVREDLFWFRTFYGLLSLPFAIFKVPVLSGMLTHAKPTAYNRNGRTVPRAKKKPWVEPPGYNRNKHHVKDDIFDIDESPFDGDESDSDADVEDRGKGLNFSKIKARVPKLDRSTNEHGGGGKGRGIDRDDDSGGRGRDRYDDSRDGRYDDRYGYGDNDDDDEYGNYDNGNYSDDGHYDDRY